MRRKVNKISVSICLVSFGFDLIKSIKAKWLHHQAAARICKILGKFSRFQL